MINCPERPIAAEDKERIFKGSNWEVSKKYIDLIYHSFFDPV